MPPPLIPSCIINDNRKTTATTDANTKGANLLLELLFSAVGVVLQLAKLLLAHAHDLAPLAPPE